MTRASITTALARGAGDSPEYRALLRAVVKAGDDQQRAIKNVCRLYHAKDFDALPAPVRSVLRQALRLP